jgi:hypothetical protein
MLAPLTFDLRLSTLNLELHPHAEGFCSNTLKTRQGLAFIGGPLYVTGRPEADGEVFVKSSRKAAVRA